MSSRRPKRVASAIQQSLSSLLRTEMRDDVLLRVDITGVRVTPDLQLAHVYYGIGSEDVEQAAAALERASGYLRRAVAEQVNLRRAPQLVFHHDTSLERGRDMEALLEKLRQEGQMGGDDRNGED